MAGMLKKSAKILAHFKNPLFEIKLKDTKVVLVETAPKSYDSEEIGQLLDNIRFVSKGQKHLILIDCDQDSNVSFDGLKLLASHDSSAYAVAKAYVLRTTFQRMMANFYFRYFNPKIPMAFFRSRLEAELWLLRNFRRQVNVPAYQVA